MTDIEEAEKNTLEGKMRELDHQVMTLAHLILDPYPRIKKFVKFCANILG